uniref:Uncharacterized protein n=1 Tax=Knipowitschia caucasica TaxID=637954 RepID=A0AAV2KUF6_KNICA
MGTGDVMVGADVFHKSPPYRRTVYTEPAGPGTCRPVLHAQLQSLEECGVVLLQPVPTPSLPLAACLPACPLPSPSNRTILQLFSSFAGGYSSIIHCGPSVFHCCEGSSSSASPAVECTQGLGVDPSLNPCVAWVH